MIVCVCECFHVCECVHVCVSVVGKVMPLLSTRLARLRVRGHHMPCLMLWMIWKMADPQTTKTNSASSHGPTGDFSSFTGRDVFWTCPRCVMVLLCRSFATFIRCTADMFRVKLAGLDQGGRSTRAAGRRGREKARRYR